MSKETANAHFATANTLALSKTNDNQEYIQAADHYIQAIDLFPNEPIYRAALVRHLINIGEYEGALAQQKFVVQLRKGSLEEEQTLKLCLAKRLKELYQDELAGYSEEEFKDYLEDQFKAVITSIFPEERDVDSSESVNPGITSSELVDTEMVGVNKAEQGEN